MSFLHTIGVGEPVTFTLRSETLMVVDRCRGALSREDWIVRLITAAGREVPAAPVAQIEVLRPERTVTEVPAHVDRLGTADIVVSLPEFREDFVALMKALRFHWDKPAHRWVRTIPTYIDRDDCIVDAGCRLLLAGFVVAIPDPVLRARMAGGDYVPEHTRWISRSRANGFVILWSREESFGREARRLPGAYSRSYVVYIRPEHFADVLDFAEIHDFRFTPEAAELVAEARIAREHAATVRLEAPPKARRKRKALPPVTPAVVPDALKD
jgi:hypothetical protein